MHATDPDAGLNGTVIFQLIGDEDKGPFQINPLSELLVFSSTARSSRSRARARHTCV